MENPEGVLNLLDEFAKLKSKEIPSDLEEYLSYVATSGDPVYQWSLIKSLYRQKLINVITEFYEMCPVVEIPRCPNVDPFNYETMKSSLLKRLDSFSSAPFTIQRISELLTNPRKQYNRVDKFMRAIEKNIWVVSTREPGPRESSNIQETSASLVNGVTRRVRVTVKHPKRVKSIEERIKSGHPQLIDDEEEEEEEGEEMDEYEPMEEETSTEILPNNEADDSSLQCTSVKYLIEKYENGTIFSNSEEKTDFEEKSGQLEAAAVADMIATTASAPEGNSSSSSGGNAVGIVATETTDATSEVLNANQLPETETPAFDLQADKEETPKRKDDVEELTPDSVQSESAENDVVVDNAVAPAVDSPRENESEKSEISDFDSKMETDASTKESENPSLESFSSSSSFTSCGSLAPTPENSAILEPTVETRPETSISGDDLSDFHTARETQSNLSESPEKIEKNDESL